MKTGTAKNIMKIIVIDIISEASATPGKSAVSGRAAMPHSAVSYAKRYQCLYREINKRYL